MRCHRSVGCGRYNGEHALEHFRSTGHTFSIELNTQACPLSVHCRFVLASYDGSLLGLVSLVTPRVQRVWDYSGDNYVHRLVANKVQPRPQPPSPTPNMCRGRTGAPPCSECGVP